MTDLAIAQWRWRLLVDAVTVLAADPSTQVRWVGDAHVDELGLDFDNVFAVVSTLQQVDGVEFTAEALQALGRIDATPDVDERRRGPRAVNHRRTDP